jgi:hypothetical protein
MGGREGEGDGMVDGGGGGSGSEVGLEGNGRF